MNKYFKILEFDKILDELLKFTDFSLTRNKILNIKPILNNIELNKQFSMLNEMKNIFRLNLNLPLNKLNNITQPLKDLCSQRTLSIEDIIDIANNLKTTRLLKNFFSQYQKDFANLYKLTSNLFSNKELEDDIFNTFDDKFNVVDDA